MSRYSGRIAPERRHLGQKNKGVARATRARKRAEADERNAGTPVERRRKYRSASPEERLLLEIFHS